MLRHGTHADNAAGLLDAGRWPPEHMRMRAYTRTQARGATPAEQHQQSAGVSQTPPLLGVLWEARPPAPPTISIEAPR